MLMKVVTLSYKGGHKLSQLSAFWGKKSTLHSGKSALGPLVLERIVVNLMVNVFSKLYFIFHQIKLEVQGVSFEII